MGIIPPVIAILLITGYLTYQVSFHFINTALERSVRLQTKAMAHEITRFFERCRDDLLFITQETDVAGMKTCFARYLARSTVPYVSMTYISQNSGSPFLIVKSGNGYFEVLPSQINEIRPSPFYYYEKAQSLTPGQVWLSQVIDTELPVELNPSQKRSVRVIHLITPCCSGTSQGFLILSVDAKDIRNILSTYNSPKSPIWAYPRTPETRYAYLLDKEGWILFQSDDPDKPDSPLSTYLARSSYSGTLGKPGLPEAFRPAALYGHFWKMVNDLKEGKHDLITLEPSAPTYGEKVQHFSYAPVFFASKPNEKPDVYAGLAYVDVSRLTIAAGYKQIDMMFIITTISTITVAALIYLMGHIIMRPILKLSKAVTQIRESNILDPIGLPYAGYEINALQSAINEMMMTVKRQIQEIREKDRAIENISLKEPVTPEGINGRLSQSDIELPDIIGSGTAIAATKSEIVKAAKVDVDVLILGETGTGKQLAAEAIHRLSQRAQKPFIAINCGALDENLLLDTLFGHIKGAFTEAKTDRKGAFLQANGGTLFLDEIQSASLRVQQSMLRTISMRKIKPLGNDFEIDVDVRLIAASNADLKALIARKRFREDLYYRLKVVTIHTPPLRNHNEDIPNLATFFLRESEQLSKIQNLGFSRGAIEKMRRYNWPGNVRELKNCITRAAVMAENRILQAEDIRIDLAEPIASDIFLDQKQIITAAPSPESREAVKSQPIPDPCADPLPGLELNPRQASVYPILLEKGSITRTEYQMIAGGDLPSRTALYDLGDLVKKGLLIKSGGGAKTRYIVPDKS
ncbi:MAG: sigma 54-interacting transcriptional regulator [Pseudomonadota bacterium]